MCELCNYEREIQVICEHSYSLVYSEMEHYLQCSYCGDSKDFASHNLIEVPYEGEHICGQQIQIMYDCDSCDYVKYKNAIQNHDY